MRNQNKSEENSECNSVVAIFESHTQAQDAVRELQKRAAST